MSTLTVALAKYPVVGYRVVLACLVLALCLPASGAQSAPTSPMTGASTAARAGALTDPAELEAFLDGVITKQLEERHIPGATVSVVKDGRLFLAKGIVKLGGFRRADETQVGRTGLIWPRVQRLTSSSGRKLGGSGELSFSHNLT
jgi:hypothetical protein